MDPAADLPILSILLATPLAGLLFLSLLPKDRSRQLQTAAVLATLVPLLLTLFVYADYNGHQDPSRYAERAEWIHTESPPTDEAGASGTSISIDYEVGIDGLSLPLVVASALATVTAALASVYIKKRRKAYYGWLLLLETGMLGTFLARDLVLFYIFLQLTLVAMTFLIGIWGGDGRERTAKQWLLVNGISSALLLTAFVIMGIAAAGQGAGEGAPHAFDSSYAAISANLADPQGWMSETGERFRLGGGMSWLLFLLLLGAFGIRMGIFPLHTWLLKASVEAPSPVAMLLHGCMLPVGAYGLLRYGIVLFPVQAKGWAVVLAVLGLINLLYGAILACRQSSYRMVLAYSAVSQMGVALLGIAAFNELGIQGAVFQLVSHGLLSALLLLLAGAVQERTGTTELAELGGLARPMPYISGVLLTGSLAVFGFPGLSGFPGLLLSLLGLFDTQPAAASAAVLGALATAVYMLRSVLRIAYGRLPERYSALRDARLIEAAPMIVLVAFVVVLGCFPSLLTDTVGFGMEELFGALFATKAGG